MITKEINWAPGCKLVFACDGKCNKAWGHCARPSIEYDHNDPDDMAYLPDHELGEAPDDPGTYEGGQGKPTMSAYPAPNKWCVRECERSELFEPGQEIVLRDFSQFFYNQPWKHEADQCAAA